MSLLRPPTPLSEDERVFLQARVASFGLLAGACFAGFLLFRLVYSAALFEVESGPTIFWHAASAAALLVMWGVLKVRRLSPRGVRLAETLGIGTSAVAIECMTLYMQPHSQPHYILLLALTCVLTARAIYVPSSALRTLALGVGVGVTLVGVVYWDLLAIDVAWWTRSEASTYTAAQIALSAAIYTAAWWALSMVTTTAASSVIYGLRREVRDARQLGQYKLEEKLGEGGMGQVYRARHGMLLRPTAVKLLLPDKAGERAIERFALEVRNTARLAHPNVVTIFDYGRTPDGVFYYAMELIDGATVAEVVELTGPQPAARTIHLLGHAAAALVAAHGIDLIHRDIKPANIMVRLPHRYGGVDEQAVVLDFGLVKEVAHEGAIDVTHAGVIIGTPQYMSPEAIAAPETVGARSDLYALGCVGYYLLTGEHVFVGRSVVEVCAQHLKNDPVPPSERLGRAVPSDLERLVLACLAKDPEERPASALVLQQHLHACGLASPWSARDAQEWWGEYGDSLRGQRERDASFAAATIEKTIVQ